jgi:hypothetical protein
MVAALAGDRDRTMTERATGYGMAPMVDIIATAEGTAMALAKQGLPCFPCRNDKRPTTPRGFKDATREQSELREVWERYPGSLVGVPTGEISGLDVLDIDPRHGGDHWFAEHKHHLLPTRVHRTRTGGLHLYYRHESGLRVARERSLLASMCGRPAATSYGGRPPVSRSFRTLRWQPGPIGCRPRCVRSPTQRQRCRALASSLRATVG